MAEVTVEQKAKMKEMYKNCVDTTSVDKELITKARAEEFVEDDKLKAYMQCMYLAFGFMDEDGTLHIEVVKFKLADSVDMTKASAMIDKCCLEKDEVVSNIAYSVYKFFRKAIGQEFRLF